MQSLRAYLSEGEMAALRYALGVPRQAPVNQTGSTLGARAGSSLEFKDHRAYEPGDDLRHIDWSAYARTDDYEKLCFWFTGTWAVLVSVLSLPWFVGVWSALAALLALPWYVRQVRAFRPPARGVAPVKAEPAVEVVEATSAPAG